MTSGLFFAGTQSTRTVSFGAVLLRGMVDDGANVILLRNNPIQQAGSIYSLNLVANMPGTVYILVRYSHLIKHP